MYIKVVANNAQKRIPVQLSRLEGICMPSKSNAIKNELILTTSNCTIVIKMASDFPDSFATRMM